MTGRRGRAVSALALAGLLAVAALAVFDAVGGDGEEAPARAQPDAPASLQGPDVPAPGALTGTLYVAEFPGCRLRALDLERLTLGEPGPATACRVWTAPGGRLAVASRGGGGGRFRRELWLVRLADPPQLVRRLGPSRSAPAWSPDGSLVAWCDPDGATIVLDVATGRLERAPGCYPTYLATGTLATRDGSGPSATILEDGLLALEGEDLANGLSEAGAPARILGTGAAADGSLLVAVLGAARGFSTPAALERWRDGVLEGALAIPAVYMPAVGFFGFRIDVSPSGNEAAFVFPERSSLAIAEDLAGLVDLRTGRLEKELLELPYASFTWSPDGTWLAIATGREIQVYGTDRSTPAYVLPVEARGLAWAS